MAQWKFQFLPNQKGIISVGYRMDDIGQAVEDDVNNALRYPFKFHKVNKVVVRLGLPKFRDAEYVELIGVAELQYSDFDAGIYLSLPEKDKIELLRDVVWNVFDWFEENFEDAHFVERARNNLAWDT